MTLGNQFNKTYWENPDTGKTHAFAPVGMSKTPEDARRTNENAQIGYSVDPSNESIENYQGLLLNPYEGTGLPADPLVSKKDRRATVNKVLGLGDVESKDPVQSGRDNQTYIDRQNNDFKNYKSTGLFRKVLNVVNKNVNSTIGFKKAEGERRLLSNSLVNSSMPMQEIQKLENTVQMPTMRTRGGKYIKNTGGDYNPRSKRITIERGRPFNATRDTLMHELGHAQDPGIKEETQTWREFQLADPREEGLADGYKDAMRTGNLSRDFLPELYNIDGYTFDSEIWDNPTQRALYAATRAHQATNPNQHNPVPRRSWYKTSGGSREDNLRHSDDALLHHLVSNNPHLYDILDKEHYDTMDKDGNYEPDKPAFRSLGDVARESSQRHLERTYGPAPEQLKLFED
jgi:hypothetical protein